jgi:hypothetical protein
MHNTSLLTCIDMGTEILSGEAEAVVAPLSVCRVEGVPTYGKKVNL